MLAQLYKTRDCEGHVTGGPAYYISKGLGCKWLAAFFSVAIIIALGFIGNMVQANSIADAFHSAFSIPTWIIGVILALLAGFVFFGGMRRIAATTEKIVPLMAVLYLAGGLWVLLTHLDMLLPAFKMIFVGAFDPSAATGGLIGAGVKEAMRYGVARGLFSNEAGMGSTPHAHAVAKVKYPAQQGFVAIMGVFVDTFVVLNMTAFVIFVTGAIDGSTTGIALTQKAFETGLGSTGMVSVLWRTRPSFLFSLFPPLSAAFLRGAEHQAPFGSVPCRSSGCWSWVFLVLPFSRSTFVWELGRYVQRPDGPA